MRAYITLLVAAIAMLVLATFLAPLLFLAKDSAATRAVAAADIRIQSLAPVVSTGDRTTVAVLLQQTATKGYQMTVLWPDGQMSGDRVAIDPAMRLAARGRSLTVATGGGQEILEAVLGGSGGTAVIRVFVSDEKLREGVVHSWTVLALLSLGLLTASVVLADLLTRAVVRRISALEEASRRLSLGDMSARVELRPGGPRELRNVSNGLNDLADRISHLLARERESAADVSHRLRTPLTVLRLEVETLSDPAEAERVAAQITVLERTVTDLINETRRPVRATTESCDATELVVARVEFWSALAEEQHRAVHLDVPEGPLGVRVPAEDLSTCLDVLLTNVFAHTPAGSPIGVCLRRGSGGAYLEVDDAGPGFNPRHLVTRGASSASSSGLGLDIVRRTAEAGGGSLQLGVSRFGGAQVVVRMGITALSTRRP